MTDKKKQFENSFKGYHKDAPKFLRAKSKAIKRLTADELYRELKNDTNKRPGGWYGK